MVFVTSKFFQSLPKRWSGCNGRAHPLASTGALPCHLTFTIVNLTTSILFAMFVLKEVSILSSFSIHEIAQLAEELTQVKYSHGEFIIRYVSLLCFVVL
jgi:hypothetical protein